MAASADSVNTNTDTPTSQDISFENDGPKSPVSLQSGQWQTYVSDKTPVSQKKTWKKRDPVSIERSNLVNICKLVVKELIESSLKFGRMLDSDSVPLQHFFIVLEHVLRHGLKPKRGILGPKKELWDLFQMVEKWSYEAQDITASVRDLPTVKTHIGRARAWLRLALMQKKLADYFRLLIERRDDLLTEFYEPGALMLADEAIVIMGLLVGLNVIDCNLCVKEEDLDSQMGVIDFSLYLRNAGGEASPDDSPEQTDMTTVLDQKNYIEELNRHLNATVTDLQAKMETLTTTNALMKEDLAIAKNSILHLQEDNDRLRKDKGLPTQQQQEQLDREAKKASRISVIGCEEEMQDLKQQLEEESAHRKQVERELELQIQMKAESEMAAKLLEKDIHEKQDTIISLRRQLDDIKVINLEMYKKLQECEQEIFEKGMMVERLQEKTSKISSMLINLQNSEALSFHSSSTSHAQQK
nr:RUN and FYVE domain-containing protein 2-like isoform X2 [Penaeus vannamei]